MKFLKMTIPGMILATGLFLTSTVSYGTVEFSKKEKKACATCHPAGKTKELTATGKCYKEKKSLEGCAAANK